MNCIVSYYHTSASRVTRVISCAQPCNHASVARSSAPTHPLRLPGPAWLAHNPQRPEANISRANKKKHLKIRSTRRAYTVNDPTCFRCRVGRFSEFEFRLPESGPIVHPSRELMDSGPKRCEKPYEMKAGCFEIDISKRGYYHLLLFSGRLMHQLFRICSLFMNKFVC